MLDAVLVTTQRWIDAHILSESLLDNSVDCELLVGSDEHFSGRPTFDEQLEEGVISERHPIVWFFE